MQNAQVIHSLLTALTMILTALSLWAAWRTTRLLQGAEAIAAVIDTYEPRIDSLERGQDRFADSLARLNGRIGAMVAKENKERASGDDGSDDNSVDNGESNAERDDLFRKLAARRV